MINEKTSGFKAHILISFKDFWSWFELLPVSVAQWALIFGIFLRFKLYFKNESLLVDESWVAIEATSRHIGQILQNDNIFVVSSRPPALFLALLNISTQLFGNNEMALRLVPFLFGIGSLFLFYRLARQFLTPALWGGAVWLFSICEPLLYYAVSVRRYSSSLFVALLLWFMAGWVFVDFKRKWRIFWFGLVAAMLLWMANASVYVVSAVLLTVTIRMFFERKWELLVPLSLALAMVVGSFGAIYSIFLKDVLNNPQLKGNWEAFFWTGKPFTLEALGWFGKVFLDSLANPAGIGFPAIMVILMVVGIVGLFKKSPWMTGCYVLPIILVMAATLAGKYPFQGRVIIFLVPAYYLLIFAGGEFLGQKLARYRKVFLVLFLALVLFRSVNEIWVNWGYSRPKPDNRPVLEFFRQNFQPGDQIFLDTNKRYSFWYYAGNLGYGKIIGTHEFPYRDQLMKVAKVGVFSTGSMNFFGKDVMGLIFEQHLFDQRGYFQDAVVLKGEIVTPVVSDAQAGCFYSGRAWLFLPNPEAPAEKKTLQIIKSTFDQCGKRVMGIDYHKASMYLYDRTVATEK